MKKILFVTRPISPPWDEASKNFAYGLAREIGESDDFQIHLLTKNKLSELPNSVTQKQIYTHAQNDFSFSQKMRLFWFLWKNAKQYDIIHFLFTPSKLNTWMMKKVLRLTKSSAKTIQTVATLREDLLSNEEIKNLMFADLIITYSDYAKSKLKSLGIKNVKRIYPGIDTQEYSKKENIEEIRKKYGFSSQDFVINFSGEYTRLGAMDDVIESFIQISKKIPETKLSLAVRVKNEKDAQKKKEVVKKLKETNTLERVAFHDDGKYKMSEIYNLCDISLFPVRNMHGKFDVPLAVVEAMACEKPVIISDIPILQEFSNEQNSVQIKTGDISELTNAILNLHKNKEKRTYVRTYARKYVQENFNIKNSAQKYEEIYRNL